MDHEVISSRIDLDLDIDLESAEEDVKQNQPRSDENSKMSISSVSSYGSVNARDCSPRENRSSSDEIHCKKKEMQLAKSRDEIENSVDKMSDGKKKHKKQSSSARPPRPHRHPRGPSLGAYDMKLIQEISDLNLKRRMARIRMLNKIKRNKASSSCTGLLACFVTIIFLLVVFLQGLLGSHV